MTDKISITLEEYCRGFIGADNKWPELPLEEQTDLSWWSEWIKETPPNKHFEGIRNYLPQLWIKPQKEASKSETYKRLVLKGESYNQSKQDAILELSDPVGFSIRLAKHPCGTLPVIEIEDRDDFLSVVRCLAYRCELNTIQPSVHAQAISGLIHWGLIRKVNNLLRAKLIILHRSPYSSLPARLIPGNPTNEKWIELSQHWRLEHELTHLATKRLVGEMRLNLYDELIADALGMLKALKIFSADLFRIGLGLNMDSTTEKNGRVHTYLREVNTQDQLTVCKYTLQRAYELEELITSSSIPHERIALLRYLTAHRLDQSFQKG